MIYTVTFNPSLDYIVGVDEFKTGKVNRTAEELILPGGKGINVSIVLKNLGMESIPLGFAGGFTGEEIHRLLKERKVEEQFVRVKKGISRINVKLRSLQVGENGEKTVSEESEINGMGPEQLWCSASPIWYRPQVRRETMYGEDSLLQVVGHTPVEKIYRSGNVISCDVFSTYRDGRPIGTQKYPVIDTVEKTLYKEV